jgi:RNA polymerase sigma-70 factor (ECF subfamily)
MSNQGSTAAPSLSLKIDEICDRFESQWLAGQRPRLEDYLHEVPEPVRGDLLRELLLGELECRRRAGEVPAVEEYGQRFPGCEAHVEAAFATAAANTRPEPRNAAVDVNVEPTSISLLNRLREGQSDAWQRLARMYAALVYAWCRRFDLAREDTADVVQEVFRAVHGSLSSFRHDRPGDSFRGWLWTITRSKIQDHFRGRQDRPQAPGGTDAYRQLQEVPAAEDTSGTSASPFGDLGRRAIELMRQDFAEPTWRAFWETTVDGRSPDEVARELGMTVGGVYQAKSRVLRRLRAELAGLADE